VGSPLPAGTVGASSECSSSSGSFLAAVLWSVSALSSFEQLCSKHAHFAQAQPYITSLKGEMPLILRLIEKVVWQEAPLNLD